MLVSSGQAPAPTDPDIPIRHPTVAKQLANIRQTTYLPQLHNSRMGKYSDLPQRKALIIAIRFIPNYSRTWVAKYGGRRHEVGHSQDVQSMKLVQLFYSNSLDRKSQQFFRILHLK
jgi:hypothetical protein